MRPSIAKRAVPQPSSLLKVLPEVSKALSLHQPVVALESTILAHGLPNPQNLQLAQDLSSIIRSKGAIPATIAVKDGICRVGLTKEELADLAISGVEQRAMKCSTRDLPLAIARQRGMLLKGERSQWGATTVASTMRIANMAGISTFVTGGTGGVHRGGETTMDISADLIELSRTPVIVVSAGVKSILDIHRTLETLETYGVPTASYQTDDYPAFFSPSSGIPSPARVDCASEVALAYLSSVNLGLPNGMLIAVPNNDPAGEAVETAIQETIEEANRLEIQGRDVTPYILKRVAEKTKGDSLKSNTELVKRNAAVGADIAIAVADQRSSGFGSGNATVYANSIVETKKEISKSRVVVMGGAVVDLVARPEKGKELIALTSNPGSCYESDGGVGRNVAEVLGRLGSHPVLFSSVGDDARGTALMQRMEDEYDIPKDMRRIEVVDGSNTATYLAVLDSDGDLHTAIADMSVLSQIPIPDEETLLSADYLVIDGNAPLASLEKAAKAAMATKTKVCLEPTSIPKASLLSTNESLMSCISYAFPNFHELYAMENPQIDMALIRDSVDIETIKSSAIAVLNKMHPCECHLIITMGADGAMLASKYDTKPITFQHFEAKTIAMNNCTGAGDTLTGAFIHALLAGYGEAEAVMFGQEKALLSLKCDDRAISPELA